jgi:NAD(P)-dependent dehydrogenase (short-subunit alcohol dehydrogenase family)
MQTLGLEGAKYNIRVNCLAPSAGTRMLDGLMTDEMSKTLSPASVSPGVVALVAQDAPNRMILCAGGGSYERAYITMTRGIYVGVDDQAEETIAQNWEAIGDRTTETIPEGGMQQSQLEFEKARLAGIVSDPV